MDRMAIVRVPPDEAARLQAEGWIYVDVRSAAEFESGHPVGAYNVPLMHVRDGVRVRNPDFARVMRARFPLETRLLLGCQTGNRSYSAAEELAELGYAELRDVRGGFCGEPDPLGGIACEGWEARGLPSTTTTAPGHGWAELNGA
jgi:rhodanese-related sulfurtransferase